MQAPDSIQNDPALLSRLQRQGVEFVIVGGMCGVLHGVTLVTKDLDICCRFTAENLYRIEAAVKDVHPRHRLAANKLPLELTDELCSRLKNLYLQTDLGTLDCLGEIAGIGGYDAVFNRSVPVSLADGEFRMLDIDSLIAAKEAVGRPHDLLAVAQLRAIKERTEQPSGASTPPSEI
jgi:hypothetical protein